MDLSFLPLRIFDAILKCDINRICEIRLRENFAIKVKENEKIFYLCSDGLTLFKSQAIYCESQDIKHVIDSVTEHSIYAFNEQIKRGFISANNGIRIGVCGSCVTDNEIVKTVKDISSLNIRIPHSIKGCADKIFDKLKIDGRLLNALIISPPGFGKTTLLKDIIRKINTTGANVLVIDERYEFAQCKDENVDIISNANKLYSFDYGVRSMSPSVVVTDELSSFNDWFCCKNASNSGVCIIASCHGYSVKDIFNKNYFISDVFKRYVVIDGQGGVGIIEGVYDEKGSKI